MSSRNVIRAGKDLEYRESFSECERTTLSENLVGMVELTDMDLLSVGGAKGQKPDATGRYAVVAISAHAICNSCVQILA